MHWTFDPLVRRNAYFNLHKLGARAVDQYLPDFYGRMTDGINAGDTTSDRLYIQWDVASPEAIAAAAGDSREVDFDRCAPPAPRSCSAATTMRPRQRRPSRCTTAARCWSPCRRTSRPCAVATRALAVAWRSEVARRARCAALEAGYRITGMARTGGTSWRGTRGEREEPAERRVAGARTGRRRPRSRERKASSVKLTGFELRRIAMPLVSPFRTSFGTELARDVLLVRAVDRRGRGLGRVRGDVRAALLQRVRRRRGRGDPALPGPGRGRRWPMVDAAPGRAAVRADQGPPDGQGGRADRAARRVAARGRRLVRRASSARSATTVPAGVSVGIMDSVPAAARRGRPATWPRATCGSS